MYKKFIEEKADKGSTKKYEEKRTQIKNGVTH